MFENADKTKWSNLEFKKDQILNASISGLTKLFVTESGELKQQGLLTIAEPTTLQSAIDELEKHPSRADKSFFGKDFDGKILKTW